ncbi:MAG: hypothetical protein AAFO69_11000 [Bacteroidota bacterium]
MTHLSFSEKKEILLSGAGTKFLIIGWLIALLFFSWLFSNAHIEGFKLVFGSTAITGGYITDMEFTNVTANDVPIYKYYYSYVINDDIFYGISYEGNYYDVDDTVNVEFLKSDFSVSRLKGSDKTLSGPVFTAIVFLLLAGLTTWLLLTVRKRLFEISIIGNGIVAGATMVSKEMTDTSINDRSLFKLHFEYEADRQKYQIVHRTTYPDEFRESERVVYHQKRPSKGMLLSKLPNDLQRKIVKSQ